MANVPSIYPTDQLFQHQTIEYNVNEIKKYQFPDCIISYFNYFEMWTPTLNGQDRKVLLNRLLQDDDVAFAIYMENVNEPYDVLKAKLVEQFTECSESLLKNKKEKRKQRKMFKRMTRDEMENYVRTTYNELNSLSKERLVIKALTKILPKKFKKMDLENKCSNVDQMVEMLGEKFNNMKLKESSEKENEKKKMKKHHHHRRHRGSSSSSSSDTSDDEKCKKKGHHHSKKHGKEHGKEKKGFGF